VACVAPIDYFQQIVAITIIPLALVALVTIVFGIGRGICTLQERNSMVDDRSRFERQKLLNYRYWKLLMFTCFLMYPGVSSKVMSFFVCQEVEGSWYLVADFGLHCYDSLWSSYRGYVLICVIIYPVGIPTFTFAVLFKNRRRLAEIPCLLSFGFIYEAYNQNVWFFEVVDMLYKFVVTSLLVFAGGKAGMVVGMLVCTLYTVVILTADPYIRKMDFRLHLASQSVIYLLLLSGNILTTQGNHEYQSQIDTILSAFLFFVTFVVFVMFLLHLIMFVRRHYWRVRRLIQKAQGNKTAQDVADVSSSAGNYEYSTTTANNRDAVELSSQN